MPERVRGNNEVKEEGVKNKQKKNMDRDADENKKTKARVATLSFCQIFFILRSPSAGQRKTTHLSLFPNTYTAYKHTPTHCSSTKMGFWIE